MIRRYTYGRAVGLTLAILAGSFYLASAQGNYNLSLLSHPGSVCGNGYNDVWGFRHTNGQNYAILGTRCGTTIYNLQNPSSPSLVINVPGAAGTWRDMKNFGDMIYVVADQGEDGLLIIDMSDPDPDSIQTYHYKPEINGVTLLRAHNLYIDNHGFIYLAGANVNGGGVIAFYENAADTMPPVAGIAPSTYAHDVYVNEARNLMITSEINDGQFAVFKVTRGANTVSFSAQASQQTSRSFTHNAWTNDGGTILFTTDERGGSYVDAWDISNLNDIELLDRYAPHAPINSNPLPHNVHVRGNHAIVSHYQEGVKILDFSRPHNLVEVASYRTSTSGSGCWGVFPHFSQNTILASDIGSGLFVLQPNYSADAAYLEGDVIDHLGQPIDDAMIQIVVSDTIQEMSAQNGSYATGMVDQTTVSTTHARAASNTVQVIVRKDGYVTKDTMIDMQPGQVISQDFMLMLVSLPVELIHFDVTADACEHHLSWTVGEEINHSHFEVEQSADGFEFGSIARINPTARVANTYRHEVVHPLHAKSFYRLAQVDLDGTVTYSHMVSVASRCPQVSTVQIFPNPVQHFLQLSDAPVDGEVQIYDRQGTLVLRRPWAQQMDVSTLHPGTYIAVIKSADGSRPAKFVKL